MDEPAAPAASFDSVILAAVIAECARLVGASVQRVSQTGPDEIVLTLRARGRARALLISSHPRWGRMHLVGRPIQGESSSFTHLLRSRLEGALLRSLDAPAFERLVTLTFETLEGVYDLVVEIMGRQANQILCQNGMIVGALRTMGVDRARGRAVLPQRPYQRPAPPRTDPTTVDPANLLRPPARPARQGDSAAQRPAWRAVLDEVGGIGPALAWEVCLRGDADPTAPLDASSTTRIVAALREIGRAVAGREFTPILYRDDLGRPQAYAAFPMRCFSRWRPEEMSMSAAVEAFTAQAVEAAAVQAAREGLAAVVARARKRVARAHDAVAADIEEAAMADRLREHGELILAYLPRIAPGQDEIEVPGFDESPVRIALDPRRSGVENAQAYFKRYARAAAARRRLPERQAALQSEAAFLDATATAIEQAEAPDDLWEIEQDLIAVGLRRTAKSGVKPRAVDQGRVFTLPGGYQVRVGRSARENDRLTFDVAGPEDLWLHARGMPGAHVILATARGEPPAEILAAAAAVAAYYSAGRRSAKVPVDVTQRRHVRRMRNGRPGQVSYTGERTLMVAPVLPALR